MSARKNKTPWLLTPIFLKWPARVLHVLFLLGLAYHQACVEDRVHALEGEWRSEHPVRMR